MVGSLLDCEILIIGYCQHLVSCLKVGLSVSVWKVARRRRPPTQSSSGVIAENCDVQAEPDSPFHSPKPSSCTG